MTKAFDTVNIHQLIHKIHNTHIPTTIIKFLANYLKGRRQYTSYNNHTSKHTKIKAGVSQGGVLSPTLFNIYLSDIPLPKINSLNLITYADDITSLENNHWLHSRHQHPPPPLRDQNPPTPKPSQTSRITTHTKSLPPHSSPTPTHHRRSPPQLQKTIHIQQQHQLHPKHTLLHPNHLSNTNKKQHENNTHKNTTRLHIIHSQQNPQKETPTHS